ncbi:MAG: MDR family MFS transporter [Candidatus Rokuibacteriota bacterium]
MDERAKRCALWGVMLAIFLAAIESTVVALAMPSVVASLGGVRYYSWVFSGYLLTQTITLPLWGRLSDIYGRRAVYLAGLATFLAGSALSGASHDMAQLIAFRMIQGLGAGSLMTLGYTLVGELFGLEQRAKMQGYLSGVWGVASMVGPPVGGLLTDFVSWRWVFYMNLPFGIVAMALIWAALRHQARPTRRGSLDYRGAAYFTLGLTLVLLGLVEAGREGGGWGPGAAVLLAAGVASLGVLVAVERRAADPLLPLRLFESRMIVAAVATRLLVGTAMFGALAFIPLFVQKVTGLSATGSGAVLAPFVIGWVIFSPLSARLVLRLGYRSIVAAGMACLTGAFWLMSRWDSSLTLTGAMRDVALAGVGMGLVVVPMLIAVQSAVDRRDLGVATSLIQLMMSVGGMLGVAAMGTVMAHRLDGGLPLVAALHGVFVTGLIVSALAFAAAFLVPGGRAQDLARPEMRGEPAPAAARTATRGEG